MIYLDLFLNFLEVGAVSFGGGYGMISLIRQKALANGWMTEDALLNMIAVAESTPGPIAVNMATFVGSRQGGIPGALVATLGVVLPAFLIILLIASVLTRFLKYKKVEYFLCGIRPCIVAMILATGITMILTSLFGFVSLENELLVDIRGIIILGILFAVTIFVKAVVKKKIPPIAILLLSAGLGILFYSNWGA